MTVDASDRERLLDARIDKLTQALMYVAGELWTARDRQAVLERILIEGQTIAPGSVDSHRPDAALAEALTAERETFVARILDYLAPDN
ncbi:hypothetical protein FHS31_002167 [Sphingomonas vulcanisoli]|uniref:Uncharacterized protein n=1 Tax=Sphingomonas vulcanisoli TaxID=1658060 RepID=A0ABX0TY42_9SPHN|nr:hypothetical protein [Sphingomonas vulcanisoli]NIJ08546.1 hypothetical protein [Sphingomonas vulcanisoli]